MTTKTKDRAISVSELLNTRHKVMPFTGEWEKSFGCPELRGSMLVYGPRKNGKTRFVLQLCKYLTKFGKVVYDSLEEGASFSMRRAFEEVGMNDVKRRIILLDKEPIDQLITRLEKRKSANVVVIDSVQYSGLKYADYTRLIDRFRNKLFIILSHANGKDPRGSVAQSIQYDAYVVVYVEGFKAFPVGRYGGGEPFVIWPEEAFKYWDGI
jgi:Predicted ATP-dependent serine protease